MSSIQICEREDKLKRLINVDTSVNSPRCLYTSWYSYQMKGPDFDF